MTVSAIVEAPWGLQVAPFVLYRSALPTHTIEGLDLNGDGNTVDRTAMAYRYTGMTGNTATYEEAGAEVIAMDSMTLYRGMDLGTAKPRVEERGGIPHHLIDVLDPWESASVADFRAWASDMLANLEVRGKLVKCQYCQTMLRVPMPKTPPVVTPGKAPK